MIVQGEIEREMRGQQGRKRERERKIKPMHAHIKEKRLKGSLSKTQVDRRLIYVSIKRGRLQERDEISVFRQKQKEKRRGREINGMHEGIGRKSKRERRGNKIEKDIGNA